MRASITLPSARYCSYPAMVPSIFRRQCRANHGQIEPFRHSGPMPPCKVLMQRHASRPVGPALVLQAADGDLLETNCACSHIFGGRLPEGTGQTPKEFGSRRLSYPCCSNGGCGYENEYRPFPLLPVEHRLCPDLQSS